MPVKRTVGSAMVLLAAVLSAVAAGAAAGVTQPPGRLVPGLTHAAVLKGGEVHRYEVELAEGTYLGVTFEQQGADLRPAILGPDGATVYEYDFGEWGPEPVTIVAPATGVYRLEARTLRADAPPGRYELRVDAIRPATPDDHERMRVMTGMIEGYAALRSRPGGTLDRARVLYEQALAGWRRLGDRAAEAHSLMVLGFVANSSDDIPASLAYIRQEIPAWQDVGNEYAEARAYRSLGVALRFLGEYEASAEAYERSLAMHRAAGRRSSESLLLSSLARHYRSSGDLLAALDRAYEAAALARELSDPQLEAEALINVGLVHLDLGEFEAAMDVLRRARGLAPASETVQGEAAWSMGIALGQLGQLDAARRLLDESLAIWTRTKWRGFQANVLMALGDLHVRQQALELARERFEQAAALSSEAAFPAGEAAARRRLGDVLLRLGRIDDAETAFAASARFEEQHPNPAGRAFALSDRARLAMARGDLASARQHAEAALAGIESVRGRAETPRIRSALLASSQAIYETLVHVLMAQHDQDPASGGVVRAFEVSERARARTLFELVLGGGLRPAPSDGPLMREVRATQQRVNAKALALDDARRRKDARAIATLSREIDELAGRLELLDGRLRREHPDLAFLVSPEPLTLAEIQRDVLDEGTVLVEYLLAEPHSYAWVVTRESVRSMRLAPRGAIEDAARRFLDQVGRPPAAGATTADLAPALADLLLEPLRGLPPGRVLVVAPGLVQSVPFAALPLPGGSRALVLTRHEIVQAPSASLVKALRSVTATRGRAPRALAVFADPVFDAEDPRVAQRSGSAPMSEPATPAPLVRALAGAGSDGSPRALPRLPFTRLEADAILALAPRGSVMAATGFSANLRRVTDPSLADYRIVHFATHGLLDTRAPEISGLVFSLVDERGRPQEGFLRLHEMGRLHLNADLVVLSGCQTARGREVAGEGVIGLTRGFMAAGARRIVASLWQVDDMATSELMTRFYGAMLGRGLAPAAALRAAQLEMAASPRWSHPYFWSGLVVQGEWR